MQLLIQLPLPVLQAYINQALVGLITGEPHEQDLTGITGVHIQPLGELTLEGKGKDVLHSSLSVEVTARIRTEGLPIPTLLRSLSPWEQIRCSLTVHFQTQLYLEENWELNASSNISYEWIQKPALGVGPLQIPVSNIVHPFLEKELQQVGEEVDAIIQKQTAIPSLIRYTWQKLHEYQLVEEEEQVWLLSSPSDTHIGLTGISVEQEAIEVGVNLPIRPRAQMGEEPKAPEVLAFPSWQSWGPFTSEIVLPLTASLPWSWLTWTTKKRNFSLNEGETQLEVHPLEVKQAGEQLSALVGFDGKLQVGKKGREVHGEIQLSGVLYPSLQKRSARISNFTFKLKKASPLLRSFAFLFRRRIRLQLKTVCNDLLKDLASMLFDQIQEAIQAVPLDQGVQLYSDLEDYELNEIELTTEGVQLSLTAKGGSRLVIEEIPG